MENKKWLVAYFSPTGTTASIAKAIAKGTRCNFREWDLSVPQPAPVLGEEEALLLALPVYGGKVPAISLERLSKLHGNGQPAVAVAVYGNRAYDDALLQEKDTLEAMGFHVMAAAAFVAEHSIIRSIAAGRPDAKDLAIAAHFGEMVAKKLISGEAQLVSVPGDPAYREKTAKPATFHPTGNNDCIKCGICAAKCPLNAIFSESPWQTDSSKCINCMRCVAICPQNARSLPAPMLSNVEAMLQKTASVYRNPELFL